mgnify:CR=1 FL=1|jgi:hypothetical protein
MQSYQQELVTVRMTLGELTFAHRAVATCYHIQDQLTGELIQIPLAKPDPYYAKIARKLHFKWVNSAWFKPVFGVVAALTLVGLAGLIQPLRERFSNSAIPIVQPKKVEPKDLAFIEGPYEQPVERIVPEQPVSNQLLSPLPAAIQQRVQSGASKVASVVPPQALPSESQPTKGDKQIDALSVVNEFPSDAKQLNKPNSLAPPMPVAKEPTYKPQLVAIQDQKTILVTSPNSRLPVKVSIGGAMPDGRRLEKVDQATGTANFEDGSSIRLE